MAQTKFQMKILVPLNSRKLIFEKALLNKAPKDFFYGSLSYPKISIEKNFIDTRPTDFFGDTFFSKMINKYLKSGFSIKKCNYLLEKIKKDQTIFSFTDWEGINLGIFRNSRSDLKIISGFHGLYNFYLRTSQNIFFSKKKLFKDALKNLDHLFFFGEKDMQKSISFFEIDEKKTSLFRFGIDHNFWKQSNFKTEIDVFSLGSDVHRDYEIFNKIDLNLKFLFLTKKGNKIIKKKNYNILGGSKNEPLVSDEKIRDYYNKSKIVVVSLHDTYQPSGYSVTLQAMACGKPVILTKIKGLWDSKVFKDRENIFFVPPNDPSKLSEAIQILISNKKLRDKIGNNALNASKDFFSLNRMNEDFLKLTKIFQ